MKNGYTPSVNGFVTATGYSDSVSDAGLFTVAILGSNLRLAYSRVYYAVTSTGVAVTINAPLKAGLTYTITKTGYSSLTGTFFPYE